MLERLSIRSSLLLLSKSKVFRFTVSSDERERKGGHPISVGRLK
jgi:hypothetical protein